ncbi:MAG: MerR family transcriptional regulator [Clostridiales bacterium]|nr:MerR family transcriptional regulator [Clostridiales bacterium]
MKQNQFYSMKETCEKTGLTYDALKFYCNEGLIPNVKRDKNNYRIFSERDVEWIKSLSCLKNCGMSIVEMKEYLALCLQGEGTIPARKVILAHKLEELENKIKEVQESIHYIHWKQQFYDDILSGKTPYFSNLTPLGNEDEAE